MISIYLSLYLSIYRSIYRSIGLSIYRSICLSIYLSMYLCMYLSLSLSLSLYLSLYLSISLSLYLSIYPSIYRSAHPSIISFLFLPRLCLSNAIVSCPFPSIHLWIYRVLYLLISVFVHMYIRKCIIRKCVPMMHECTNHPYVCAYTLLLLQKNYQYLPSVVCAWLD
jgi:hypothetical protein